MAMHGSFAQLVHVSAANAQLCAQRHTQTLMSARLGANPIPIRDSHSIGAHSLMALASLLAVAYEAAANASLGLKKRGRNHERPICPPSALQQGQAGCNESDHERTAQLRCQDILAMTLHFLGHETTFRDMQFAFGRPDSSIATLVRLARIISLC
jgi:hypothetical protein